MSNPQSASLLENLRKVINLVDQLRDIGLNDYIKLPRIVVLGIQSSGKSSLLEHIVGIDFLPRGSGVVTRRPLELRLSYVPKSVSTETIAEFVIEDKGKKYTDFEQVRKKIIELTDKVCGTSKNIIDNPIILAVSGSNCPDLTLVDLPGITRIPIDGQPKDIEAITTNMAKRYCEDPSTIILCVVAANADMSTSDALLMAKKLDPNGIRTIGVLTKIDIMDQGTNALKMLRGEEVNLSYGYVGVKLRSQKDINDNIPILQAIELEKKFFANHPVYSTIPGEIFGTTVLTGKLTRILYKRIRSFLPQLMQEINQRINRVNNRIEELGPGLPIEDSEKLHFIWQLIHEFSVKFRNSITGQYEKSKLNKMQLTPAGAKIRLLFQDLYEEYAEMNYQALKKFNDAEIQQVIQKYQAITIPGFLPVDAFYALLNPELRKLQSPALECLDHTYGILEEYAITILQSQLTQLPSVMTLLQQQVIDILQECKKDAQQSVQEVLEAELNYIFTNDYNYLSGKPFAKFSDKPQSEKQAKGDPMVVELKGKIEHYFKLVVRATRDNIPKLIGYFLVKGCQTKMLLSLQQNLMQNQQILDVVSEAPEVVQERIKLSKEIETFKNAQKIIKRDPDLSEYILKGNEDEEEQQREEQKQKQEELKKQQDQKKKQLEQEQQQQKKEQDNKKQQQQQLLLNKGPQSNHQKTDVLVVEPPPQKPNESSANKYQQQQQQQQQQLLLQQQQQQALQNNQKQTNSGPLGGNKPSVSQQYNQAVDKGVASAFENQQVKDAMKNAGGTAARQTVQSQMPGAPDWVLKGAEKAGQQAASSDAAKQAAINATANQLKAEEAPIQTQPQPQKKGGLFGFIQK